MNKENYYCFVKWKPNSGHIGSCVPSSIAEVLGKPYKLVRKELAARQKEFVEAAHRMGASWLRISLYNTRLRGGCPKAKLARLKRLNNGTKEPVFTRYLDEHGWEKITMPKGKMMFVGSSVMPDDLVLVLTRSHVFVCCKGVAFDTFDPAEQTARNRRILAFYIKKARRRATKDEKEAKENLMAYTKAALSGNCVGFSGLTARTLLAPGSTHIGRRRRIS